MFKSKRLDNKYKWNKYSTEEEIYMNDRIKWKQQLKFNKEMEDKKNYPYLFRENISIIYTRPRRYGNYPIKTLIIYE